jgi:replication factor A1
MGVVKSASEVTTIITRQTNKELKKRDIHLVDDSNCSVNCTLWGKQVRIGLLIV